MPIKKLYGIGKARSPRGDGSTTPSLIATLDTYLLFYT
jgi:hypothetical protein